MPLPMERDPRAMFESLFGQGATAEDRASRRRDGLSILDGIRERRRCWLATWVPAIGIGSTQYLDGVREIERRLLNVERDEQRRAFPASCLTRQLACRTHSKNTRS